MAAVEISVPEVRRRYRQARAEETEDVIKGTLARARIVAPCIADALLSADHEAAAKDALLDAIASRLRRGAGGPRRVTQDSVGVDYGDAAVALPAALITELQGLCRLHTAETTSAAALPAYAFPPSPTDSPGYTAALQIGPAKQTVWS